MALTDLQERVSRTIFHTIRKVLVAEGYLPDITNTGLFGTSPYTAANETAWVNACKAIATTKGFCIEVFGTSQTKGMKAVPRIAIISRRTLPGDIGSPSHNAVFPDPLDPSKMVYVKMPLETSHFYFDIQLASNSAAQDNVLNAVLSKALGVKKYIPYYDDATQLLFIRQTSDFDLPDTIEGITEKVYTYETPDLFNGTEIIGNVVPTKRIELELKSTSSNSSKSIDEQITDGETIDDSGIIVETGQKIVYP